MKVIPVLDILNGNAVHAVRGERQNYQPLRSALCPSSRPIELASNIRRIGFNSMYLADLDAICHNSPNFRLIGEIAKTTRLYLMVDAAANDVSRVKGLLEMGVSKVVIGTETLTNLNFIEKAIDIFGSDSIVLSLDLKNNQFFGSGTFSDRSDPLEAVGIFRKMCVRQLIVLDLAKVGSEEGIDVRFVKRVLEVADFEVFVGGGIRDLADLAALEKVGVSGALISSALHNERITVGELRQSGFSL